MDRNWYRNFFEGVALDLWRKAIPLEQTRIEVDFLERALGLSRGARVLDVPCGAGRHSLEFATRGLRPTGVDLSEQQIAEAQGHSKRRGVAVEWKLAEMRDLPWEAEFDGAFCFGNSFGYLEPQSTRAFLASLSRALKPGARFVLETGMAAESAMTRFREREWIRVDDILFLEENRYLVEHGCVETRYTFVRDGVTTLRTGLHWVYTLRELYELLAQAGLSPVSHHGSLGGEPFALGSPHLLLVAERAE